MQQNVVTNNNNNQKMKNQTWTHESVKMPRVPK